MIFRGINEEADAIYHERGFASSLSHGDKMEERRAD
jgi:hypothetical protein